MRYELTKETVLRIAGMVAVFFCMFVATPTFAAQISFSAPTMQVSAGQQFRVAMYLDTGGENVNAISATIHFPNKLLQMKEILDANSVIPLWIEQPHIVPNGVSFAGIIPGGYNGGNGLVLTLVFQALSTGNGSVSAASVQALRNDGQGSEIQVSTDPLALIVTPASEQPLNTQPVRDINPPEPFTPQVAKDPALFNDQWFVSFATTDKETGVARYQIKEVASPLFAAFTPWEDAQSPYLLKDQTLGSYIYVRAIDQAGNSRTERVDPQRPLSWYENPEMLILLLLLGVIILGWYWTRAREL